MIPLSCADAPPSVSAPQRFERPVALAINLPAIVALPQSRFPSVFAAKRTCQSQSQVRVVWRRPDQEAEFALGLNDVSGPQQNARSPRLCFQVLRRSGYLALNDSHRRIPVLQLCKLTNLHLPFRRWVLSKSLENHEHDCEDQSKE